MNVCKAGGFSHYSVVSSDLHDAKVTGSNDIYGQQQKCVAKLRVVPLYHFFRLTGGVQSSLHVAHPGYQVLSDRLGLIANALTPCSAKTVAT